MDSSRVKATLCMLSLLSVMGCELHNPLLENKRIARATPATPVVIQQEDAATLAPRDVTVLKPPGLTSEEISARIRAQRLKRQASGAASPKLVQARTLDKAATKARALSSKDFTTIAPDGAATATRPPTAEDLPRYVADLGEDGRLMATLYTTLGEIPCELFEDKAPITVANFVGLSRGLKAWMDPATNEPVVGAPLYQDVLFHRVIPEFMIQGGDPLGVGRGGPGYKIPDELDEGLRHKGAGILSMAHAGANTGGSQFFITGRSAPDFDDKYSVFGRCKNSALIHKIANVPRNRANRPKTDVLIKKIEISRAP